MQGKSKQRTKRKAIAKIVDVHAESELPSNLEDDADTTFAAELPDDSSSSNSDEDKHRFQKNYRTRFVKRRSKKSGQADVSPQIKRRGRVTHKFPSSKTTTQSHPQPPSTASDDDDSIPSTSTVPGNKRAEEGSSQASPDALTIHGNADEMLLKILSRANQAMQQIPGHNATPSSHEEEVKSFAQYLATLMMKIPQGQAWKSYSKQLLALTMDFGSRHDLQQQKPSQQQYLLLNCSGSESLTSTPNTTTTRD
ncbi:uncharacterized protein LOC144042911 [Vanacampus margaritifer]